MIKSLREYAKFKGELFTARTRADAEAEALLARARAQARRWMAEQGIHDLNEPLPEEAPAE